MNNSSPLIKRIRRHINGRLHTFFISTPPGLEDICEKELLPLLPENSEIKTTDGGVEFKGKLDDCYNVNLHIKTATRVLMRITDFNAENFRRLEKKLKEIPWELLLKSNSTPRVTVTTRHSRLFHSDAISERVVDAINDRKKAAPFLMDESSDARIQNIFVRSIDDHITVSLDASGDLLYKRGIKHHTGKAPIRENLAAAALLKVGYTGEEPLLDPMCGTGTFSIEAAMIAGHMPPGWYREFTFQSWPGFRPTQWNYLKKQAEKHITTAGDKPVIMACDKDKEICRILSETLKKYNLTNTITVKNDDFFNLTPADVFNATGFGKPGLAIINPPYGIRLGTIKNSRNILTQIIDRLINYFHGWKFALFSPEKKIFQKSCLRGEYTLIDHGGIKLTLFTGIIPGTDKNAL